MSEPKVIVVLLSYNDWTETLECLESLAKVTWPNLEVVAVDNASTAPAWEAARAKFERLVPIQNSANLGYAEGNNVGIRQALARGADYVLVLNNDTTVAPDFIDLCVQEAESRPDVAFVGPLVYHHSEPQVIQCAGGLMADWQAYHRGQNEPDQGQYQSPEEVAWITGCAIMARSSILSHIGLLDSRFFIYCEELDWCLRAREAGYKNLIVPKAKIWHKGVQRDYKPSPRVTYLSVRNELFLLTKHKAGPVNLGKALLRDVRTFTSYTLRPRWRSQRLHRNAIGFALRDFALGRYGPPPVAF